MSDTLDAVMQAAERLTRIFEGGENAVEVYRKAFPKSPGWTDSPWLNAKYVEECLMATDYENIADAVRPKGKRPAPISQQPVDCGGEDRNQAWQGELDDAEKVLEEVCPCVECMGLGVAGMFTTEADIRLELDYRSLERHIQTLEPTTFAS